MRESREKAFTTEPPAGRCDIKVWSGECARSNYMTGGNEYSKH
jgi:hypothetical protein